ncbi:hypothetical protein F8S13_24125 [Chloroflexia bacterium SDU3-3]|nr:hypothetical protein F8S13_24125 [Chloroflexia bacterium SDU3-3]
MVAMDIFHIVRYGTLADLRAVLTPNTVNERDQHGFTPLMLAEGLAKTVLLLQSGAHVNAQNSWGLTPLMCAVQAPDKGLNVAQALIEHGADVNLNQPLVLAEAAYIPLLIAHGADVNSRNRAGETRLIRAAYQVDYEAARYLLEHGADPRLENTRGQTARTIAQAVRENTSEAARGPVERFITLLAAYQEPA